MPEVAQDLGADAVVALVGLEAEPLVGFDRVEPGVLQLVGANLVGQADAAALLIEVEQHPAPFLGDPLHRRVELRPAVAARRVEDVAGQAAGMDPDQHVGAVADLAADQRGVRLLVEHALVDVDAGTARAGSAARRCAALVTSRSMRIRYWIRSATVMIGRLVPPRELHQVGHPGHGAVGLGDLADHSGRKQPGGPGQVDGRLGLPGPHQHAAVAGPQREDMTRPGEVRSAWSWASMAVRIVVARSAAEMPVLTPAPGLDADAERGVERRGVARRPAPAAGSRARRADRASSACRSGRARGSS